MVEGGMLLIDQAAILNAVQAAMIADATILSCLQLTGATAVDKAQGIIKRSQYNDLASSKSRMCIYFRPSRPNYRNQMTVESLMEIDVHVPVTRDMYAYDALKRAHELLHDKVFANHMIYFEGELGDLITAPNYFCAGMRFGFFATTKN
jgi:hypothetical protein